MRKSILLLMTAVMLSACNYVEPGYVGIRVNKLGGDKGVDQEVLGVGRYWPSWNTELYTFPIFVQTVRWSADSSDGNPGDEAIRFNDFNGLSLKVDVGVSYSIRKESVSAIFQRHRNGMDFITNVYLRNIVQDKFNQAASTMAYDEINGPKKTEFIARVNRMVKEAVSAEGFDVENVTILGRIQAPEEVQEALNNKMKAQQNAEAAKAEAEANIARARGESEANRLRTQSSGGQTLEYLRVMNQAEAIKKWNGVMPIYLGEQAPLPFIGIK